MTGENGALTLSADLCRNFDQAISYEWLCTNGTGSYASGTVSGARSRRYHGLLVAALQPPVQRTVMVAKVDENLRIGGAFYDLGANEYHDGTVNPTGFRHLDNFSLQDGVPTWEYAVSEARLTKQIWMLPHHDVTFVRYTLHPDSQPTVLTLLPLTTYRDYHSETHGWIDWRFDVRGQTGGCRVTAFNGARPYWLLTTGSAEFLPSNTWYWGFLQRQERRRGLDDGEDLYAPGTFQGRLNPGDTLVFIASSEDPAAVDLDPDRAWAALESHRRAVLAAAPEALRQRPLARQLFLAADQFVVERQIQGPATPGVGKTTLAGYHWFADWGRDTMICLPGLCLVTRRFGEARSILRTFADYVSEGMLPNRFPDGGEQPEYNTVDATLWYFQAIHAYQKASGDDTLVKDLYGILADIIAWHHKGTRYGIAVDPKDGLLHAGVPGVQLTWMDAKVGDWVVTPRIGKPVEINALWFAALSHMREWAVLVGQDPQPHADAAERVRSAFGPRFWYREGGYLYDVIDGPDGHDPSLRPNQLIALALGDALVSDERARSAMVVIEQKLLTPVGLRTLSPDDPRYRGQYGGDQWQRDGSYHQGTIWPWLLGPYLDTVYRLSADRAAIQTYLDQLLPTMAVAGIGSISEIFEGDPPHQPVGCIAQAWSVAEVLRWSVALAQPDQKWAAPKVPEPS